MRPSKKEPVGAGDPVMFTHTAKLQKAPMSHTVRRNQAVFTRDDDGHFASIRVEIH